MEVQSGLNQSSVKELLSHSYYRNKLAVLGMQDSKPLLLFEDGSQANSKGVGCIASTAEKEYLEHHKTQISCYWQMGEMMKGS